jgi:hypothetical protein
VEGCNNEVREWLNAAKCTTPLDTLALAIDHLQCLVNMLDVSLVDTLEHFETLLAAMQKAAGKEAEFEPTTKEVEDAVEHMEFLDGEGAFNGLGKSIREAIAVVNEWQSLCEDSESDEDE